MTTLGTDNLIRELESESRVRRFRRRYFLALLGAAIIALWCILAPFAALIAPYPADAVEIESQLLAPSVEHVFGTDQLGRDVFSRVITGAQISLPTGFVVVGLAGMFGILYGGASAYAGGAIEEAMMRLTDLFFCFPPLILAMAIAAALGIGWTNTIIAMVVVWWPKYARVARSLVLVQRSQEYVEAARTLGYGPQRILGRHILPNTLGPIVTLLTLDVGNAIVTFAGLSFLGLGVVPPSPEWGAMVSEGRELIEQWWVSTFPGLAIFTVVMGLNFLGDGIRDWLDPRAKRR
jgi:peptide/nickel transport system permease protein